MSNLHKNKHPLSPSLSGGSNLSPKIYFWMGVMFMGTGLLSAAGFIWLIIAEQDKTHWPIADGRVVSSWVSEQEKQYSDDSDKRSIVYSPSVTYAYEIGGRSYRSDCIATSEWYTSRRSSVEKYLRRYQDGAAVKVYYNPRDPSQARLEVGLNWMYLVFGLVIALFIGLGVWMFAIWRRCSSLK